jgi:hypothetical protein
LALGELIIFFTSLFQLNFSPFMVIRQDVFISPFQLNFSPFQLNFSPFEVVYIRNARAEHKEQ